MTDLVVERSLDPRGLDREAALAARQWTFRPAIGLDESSVPLTATLVLEFKLH